MSRNDDAFAVDDDGLLPAKLLDAVRRRLDAFIVVAGVVPILLLLLHLEINKFFHVFLRVFLVSLL